MSALKDRLRADLTTAIKARDEVRSSTLRMVLTAITNAEVAGKVAKELTDDDVLTVLTSEAKKRREAAVAFEEGNRLEMAEKEKAEAAVIADYLPEPLTDEEVSAMVAAAIAQTGAAELGMKGMGKVMGVVTPQVKGRADGGAVAKHGGRQHHRVGRQGCTVGDGDGVQAHDAVLEQMRLHDGARADGGAAAHDAQVCLGEPVGLDPRAAADLRAQRAQRHVELTGAQSGNEEPRAGDCFDECVA